MRTKSSAVRASVHERSIQVEVRSKFMLILTAELHDAINKSRPAQSSAYKSARKTRWTSRF